MEGSLLIGAIIIALFAVYHVWDFPKTLLLIAKVEPYEQAGNAGDILIIGDSTGYGTGASSAADSIAARIGADYPDYSITNNSENGRKIAGALAVANELSEQYDLVLLQIGANDLLAERDLEVVLENMLELVAAASQHTDQVVVMSSGNIGGASRFSGEKEQRLQRVSKAYTVAMERLAAENGFSFVSLYKEPAEDEFVQQPKVYLANDGLHPSSAGYASWYERLKPVLEERLNKN